MCNMQINSNISIDDIFKYMVAFVHNGGGDYSSHRWMTVCRMTFAARLLHVTDHSLSEIALICGFSSKSHFITTFRRYFGTTPSCYRRAARRKDHSEE